jgi:hypothetical protein
MKISVMMVIVSLFYSTVGLSAEVCSKVVKVGQCWSGFHAVVAETQNGDKLFLGNLSDELTKARLSVALTSAASGQTVCYQKTAAQQICNIPRSSPEWWILGGSLY